MNLVTIRDVELMKTGTWNISTGDFTVTPELIAAAVTAHESGVLRKPVIRLGHNDPRFSGDPAVGYVDNVRVSTDGQTLLGDLVGVPRWLGDIMASAYPDRSIEGLYDYTAPDGSEHPFILTGLALLGATRPGVTSLQSLQDVARLYDIAAAGQVGGTAVEISIPANTEVTAAGPAAEKKGAIVASLPPEVAQWLGTEPDADGDTIRKALDDKLPTVAVEIGDAAESVALFDNAEPEEAQPEPVAASGPAVVQGIVQLDETQYNTLMAAAGQVRQIQAERDREARENLVCAAINDGRITPASKTDWLNALEVDPGGHYKTRLASLKPGLIPLAEIGHGVGAETTEDDQLYANLFGKEA